MKISNTKKEEQLGEPIGTASNRLKKMLLFSLLKELERNFCYQCSKEITSYLQLSIEHKTPYLDSENPVRLFYDLGNIAFSHLSCNSRAARQTKVVHCGTTGYRRGCRCDICVTAQRDSWNRHDKKRRIKH